jgi:FlaA1/EpsC-like NDP-sugar epimerase
MGVVTNQSPQTYETRKLQGKVAVIFGAGGAIGSQVARELSKEGASVFLSGRAPYNINEDLLPRPNLRLHSE